MISSPRVKVRDPALTMANDLATSMEQLDAAIATLTQHKDRWLKVPVAGRITYLHQCLQGVTQVAERWATAACHAKGIDPSSSLAGEEWITGPLATLLMLKTLIATLQADGQPTPPQIYTRPDGQQVATVFPDNLADRLLWLGFKCEVWLAPGQPATQGLVYRQKPAQGAVALVLGAGNVAAIAALDTLHKLFAEDQVVVLKMNPVNAYVGQFLEQAFQPLIGAGFLRIVYGGAEAGQYLCHHPAVETIHITGATQTHDAIVWGAASEQAARKAANTPVLAKPITSELGGVTPIVVVPGRWSQAELKFQARHVASMVAHNASFNCVAGKVLVLAEGWPQREEFLALLHQTLAATASRRAYYPGAQDRYQVFLDQYPQAQPLGDRTNEIVPWTVIPNVPAQPGEYALTTEAFCGVLAEVTLAGSDAEDFLPKAVDFVNDAVFGNLACVLLVDPRTQRRSPATLDRAIAALRYGAIGINAWTGMSFLLPAVPWGAFPGNPLHHIQSGQGMVHNTYLFEHPQKSVLSAPFRIWPTPIWFADHRNLQRVARRYAEFLATSRWEGFLSIVLAALRG